MNNAPKPQRTSAGYRVYDEVALRQVRFIKRAQSIGFSLAEIRRILRLGRSAETCKCVVAMAEATLEETEKKLTDLQRFAMALRRHLARWREIRGQGKHVAGEFCRLIESNGTDGVNDA